MRFLLTAAATGATKTTTSSAAVKAMSGTSPRVPMMGSSPSSSSSSSPSHVKSSRVAKNANMTKTTLSTSTTTRPASALNRTMEMSASSSSTTTTRLSWGQQCSPSCGCVVRFEARTDPATDCIVDSKYVAKTVMATRDPSSELTPLLTTSKGQLLLTSCSCVSLHELARSITREIRGHSWSRVRNMTEFQGVRSSESFRHAVLAHWNLPRTDTHCFDVVEEAFLAMMRGAMPQPRKETLPQAPPAPLPWQPSTPLFHEEHAHSPSPSTAAIRSGPPMSAAQRNNVAAYHYQPSSSPQDLYGYGTDGPGSLVPPASNIHHVGTFQGWIDQQQDSTATAAATKTYPWDDLSLTFPTEASQWDDRYDSLTQEWNHHSKRTSPTCWESHVDELLARHASQQQQQEADRRVEKDKSNKQS